MVSALDAKVSCSRIGVRSPPPTEHNPAVGISHYYCGMPKGIKWKCIFQVFTWKMHSGSIRLVFTWRVRIEVLARQALIW